MSEAAFSPDGRLFAIRNAAVEWHESDNPTTRQLFDEPGAWRITDHWLEVYDTSALLLGTYALPDAPVATIVADGLGRVFLFHTDGVISVVRDPTRTGVCAIPAPATIITRPDSPYGDPVMKTSSETEQPHGTP